MTEAVGGGDGGPCQQTGQGLGQGKRKRESVKGKARNSEKQYRLGRQDKKAGKAPKDVCSNPSQAT